MQSRQMLKRKLKLFILLDFGLSRLTSLQFIHVYEAGFYKPTIPQSPPSHLRDYSTYNNARLECELNCLFWERSRLWETAEFLSAVVVF
jgi:hypothetical protein